MQVEAGKLRLLMVWTSKRSPNFPNVPTLNELGYDMVYDSPFGIAGPKGMDPKIVGQRRRGERRGGTNRLDRPAAGGPRRVPRDEHRGGVLAEQVVQPEQQRLERIRLSRDHPDRAKRL